MGRRWIDGANVLLLTVFKYLEILGRQAIDRFARIVGDNNIQCHQAYVDTEPRRE